MYVLFVGISCAGSGDSKILSLPFYRCCYPGSYFEYQSQFSPFIVFVTSTSTQRTCTSTIDSAFTLILTVYKRGNVFSRKIRSFRPALKTNIILKNAEFRLREEKSWRNNKIIRSEQRRHQSSFRFFKPLLLLYESLDNCFHASSSARERSEYTWVRFFHSDSKKRGKLISRPLLQLNSAQSDFNCCLH